MKQIAPRLLVGDQTIIPNPEWYVVQAAKEPWHRRALNYTGRAAPKDHPEYLVARRDKVLILNLIDVDDPSFVSVAMIDEAVAFVRDARGREQTVLIQCNQGQSRSPTLGMLVIAPELAPDFENAETQFRSICPQYEPSKGMREFARANWNRYKGDAPVIRSDADEIAAGIWDQFVDDLRADPEHAQANLVFAIASAIKSAQTTGAAHG